MNQRAKEERERLTEEAHRRVAAEGHSWEGWRRHVFEALAGTDKALSAYDVLHTVAEALNRKVVPPQIYRALESLISLGLIHRIAARNLYTVCNDPSVAHTPLIMVCERCERCIEHRATPIDRDVRALAVENGFLVSDVILEAVGRCQICAKAGENMHLHP
jgi:Fur family zinc uptake transcriptional regulator